MKDKKLVSVLTPAYNSGKYITRLLDSVLSQTYPHIEMFVVDDGSKDNTAEVVKSYISKFREKGLSLNYIYQDNSGQSVAINKGLKLVNGKYLVWPDSDDYYASEQTLEKMVERLEASSSEFAMVRVQEKKVDESTGNIIGIYGLGNKEEEPSSLFQDCLLQRFYYCPIGYMIDFDVFKREAGLDIYTERYAGQNYQMFLPILYRHRCLSINEPLSIYLQIKGSHSRMFVNYEKKIEKYGIWERTMAQTLHRIKSMPTEERENYIRELHYSTIKHKYLAAIEYGKKNDAKLYANELKKQGKYTFRDKIIGMTVYMPSSFTTVKFIIDLPATVQAKIKSILNRR